MSKLKRNRKRRRDRKDKIPFSHVRKPIPRPCPDMKDKTKYNRTKKHPKNWEGSG